jgi:cytochrome c oxidase subunit 2
MSRFLPPPASAHAGEIDLVVSLVHALMLVLFVGWAMYFVWVLFRFRAGRQPQASPTGARGRWALSVEVGIVVVEAAILVGVALPVWFSRMTPVRADEPAVIVRVVAEQFTWNVHYPGRDGQFGETASSLITPDNPLGLNRQSDTGRDDIVVQNQLHLPVGVPALVQLSSKDVIHSFGVAAMRVKQDAIPGVMTPVAFTPTVTGVYDVACSQLCGLAHFRMRARLHVDSADAFEAFLSSEADALR